jgi:hypothetical protein
LNINFLNLDSFEQKLIQNVNLQIKFNWAKSVTAELQDLKVENQKLNFELYIEIHWNSLEIREQNFELNNYFSTFSSAVID